MWEVWSGRRTRADTIQLSSIPMRRDTTRRPPSAYVTRPIDPVPGRSRSTSALAVARLPAHPPTVRTTVRCSGPLPAASPLRRCALGPVPRLAPPLCPGPSCVSRLCRRCCARVSCSRVSCRRAPLPPPSRCSSARVRRCFASARLVRPFSSLRRPRLAPSASPLFAPVCARVPRPARAWCACARGLRWLLRRGSPPARVFLPVCSVLRGAARCPRAGRRRLAPPPASSASPFFAGAEGSLCLALRAVGFAPACRVGSQRRDLAPPRLAFPSRPARLLAGSCSLLLLVGREDLARRNLPHRQAGAIDPIRDVQEGGRRVVRAYDASPARIRAASR